MHKPEEYTDDVERYLDELRESGATSMFGAAVYLIEHFGFKPRTARQCLTYWATSFGGRQ